MKKELVVFLVLAICLFLIASVAAENFSLPKPPKSPYTPVNNQSSASSGNATSSNDVLPIVNEDSSGSGSFMRGLIIFFVIIILVVVVIYVLIKSRKSRRSQASVVVSVLLIIIAIIAVAVVGTFIVKTVKDNAKYNNVDVALSIDAKGTYYKDSSGNIKDIYIRLNRNGDKANLTGVVLLFYSAGEAKIACNITSSEVVSLPLEFESKTYFFNSLVQPSEVQIYPIVLLNGQNKMLQATDKIKIKSWDNFTNIQSSDFDPLLNCIAVGGPGDSGNGPGDIGGMPF